MTSPKIEISWGELVDRISILELKRRHVETDELRAHIQAEITELDHILESVDNDQISEHRTKLEDINQKLWYVEDALRAAEQNQDFGPEFVALARSVYKLNDQRSAQKGHINDVLKSGLREVKVFTNS